MDILFPLKGLNTNVARNAQPEGTSPSLLNVVPFDRDHRARGAVRPGLSKYAPTLLGSGTQAVSLIDQVTRAVDPRTIVPSTQLLNETFTYSNGALGTVSGGLWTVMSSSASVSSGTVLVQNPDQPFVKYASTLGLGASYIIRARVKISDLGSANWSFAILFRCNSSLTQKLSLYVSRHSIFGAVDIRFGDANGITIVGTPVVTVAAGVLANNTYFDFEVRVNGNYFTAWVNGVERITPQTVSTYSTNTVVGFLMDFGSSAQITLDKYEVFSSAALSSFRQTKVVAVCGGSIFVGTDAGFTAAASGTSALAESIKPQMASRSGLCYFVDSVSDLKVLDLETETVASLVPSAGLETATTLGACTLACVWRDRLVVAAPAGTPQNFFMSRQGDPTDWDYAQTDFAAAVAGNASDAGAIGEPLNCLIPWTEDVLILGGDHSMYKVEGDIANGGQILLLTDSIGTLGPDCWSSDPAGNVYFAGTGGLYKLAPNGSPENLANETVRAFFAGIDRSLNYITLTWDNDRNGLHVHVTPVTTGTATHMYYDAGTGGFFPIQYPNSVGPIAAIVFDGDAALDRQLLLGGRDGYIRTVDTTALTDDGTAITSYAYVGPFRPAGDAALSVLEALEVILGDAPTGFTESDFQMGLSVVVAKDVYTALNSPDRTVTFSFTKQSRRRRLLQRISGGTFFFKITGVASKLWSLEKFIALFTEGGLQRRY